VALGLARPQHRGERARAGDHFGYGLAAGRAQQIVGILALRQHRELQALARPKPRHGQIHRAVGGTHAGIVAVKAEHRLLCHVPQQTELVAGERGAERRDCCREVRRRHGDHVDIAFDRNYLCAVMRCLARGGNVVERCAFVEERRLRRVQVFRLCILLERPTAKSDDAAA